MSEVTPQLVVYPLTEGEDDNLVVQLTGVEGWNLAGHGKTVKEALSGLGERMMLAGDSGAGVPAETPRQDSLAEVWLMIEMGWDMESREWFEKEAPKMGFKHPLAMAVHHMHKRCVKENPDFLRLGVSPAAPPLHNPPAVHHLCGPKPVIGVTQAPQGSWCYHDKTWVDGAAQQDDYTCSACGTKISTNISEWAVAPPAAKETPE